MHPPINRFALLRRYQKSNKKDAFDGLQNLDTRYWRVVAVKMTVTLKPDRDLLKALLNSKFEETAHESFKFPISIYK